MENNLFRKKSLEHISSPEQLHDYMRVTSPRLWMILSAVAALLIGFIIFACTTRMESTRKLKFQCESGWIESIIPSNEMNLIKIHMPVRVSGKTGTVSDLFLNSRVQVNIQFDDGAMPEDGFYFVEFPDDPVVDDKQKFLAMLTINNGFLTFYNENQLLEYLSTDRRVRVGEKLGTLTDASLCDVATVTVMLDNPEDPLPDGIYDGEIITESTTPINFLLN